MFTLNLVGLYSRYAKPFDMMTHKAEHADALRAYLIGALIPLVGRREFSDAFDRAEEFCIQQFGEALTPEKPLNSDDVTKVN